MVPSVNSFLWLLSLATVVLCKKSFKKDSGMNLEFPPEIKPPPSGVPVGHLRPLGWQRKPEERVAYMEAALTPKQFYELYGKGSKPVVFKNLLAEENTPAMTKWTDEYLRKNFGDIEMSVKEFLEDKEPKKRKMSFKEFLDDYEDEAWQISGIAPQQMLHDLPFPASLQCGTYARYLMKAELTMSSGGIASRLHHHADEHFHCLLDGRKDIILIELKYKNQLNFFEEAPHSGEGRSRMDTEMVNMFEYRAVADIPWRYATLRRGDCMYIPSKYLHQVRSYGRSVSSIVEWASPAEDDINFDDCEAWTLKNDLTLKDISLMWTHKGGIMLSNTRLSAETLRHHLLALLRTDDILHGKRFKYFYDMAMNKVKKKPLAKDVFRHLDAKKAGILTRQEIVRLDNVVLDRVVSILNAAHPAQKLRDEL